MMADYNGWTNYETWNVNLWLDNEPHTQDDLVRISNRPGGSLYEKATLLKNYVNGLPEIDSVLQNASLASDLLGAALSEVNWDEIVTNHEEEDAMEPPADHNNGDCDPPCAMCARINEAEENFCTATQNGEQCLKDAGHEAHDTLHVSKHSNWV